MSAFVNAAHMRWVVLLLTAVALLSVPFFAVGSGTEFTADILIFAIMAIGLYVQIGLLGLVNFGFSAFFGLGGYLGALLLMRLSPSLLPSLALTVLATAVVAGVFGWIALKTREIAFTMITLTFAQLLYVLAVADDKWTGGVNGLSGVPRPKLPGFIAEPLGLTLRGDAGFYYFVLVMFALVVWFVHTLSRSRLGAVFAGIRENEERMTVLGYSTQHYKLAGFVISGAIGGLAGYLNATLFGFIGPGSLFWTVSGEAILMVILGGASSLLGPIVGAAVYVGISHYAVAYTDHWRLFVGLAFIALVLFAPDGVVRILRDRLRLPIGRKTAERKKVVSGKEHAA
ncbi:branched-chain amino acid ABC transporter permease [Ramlibacter henchirensis]|uniref:Branched-chain amino acid ABC transporter permease n=1 Tax=Ramlibacter henchirensis TaxID=204072 RepID=A0A4Z0BX45_9BURK|nr:branched-chain amino acid ABC transporter permease [Ramlibacter henchirensis]TFZ02838.1 branched-chain amino acid ABC transporter permease [Ramlibacter henchirensis]